MTQVDFKGCSPAEGTWVGMDCGEARLSFRLSADGSCSEGGAESPLSPGPLDEPRSTEPLGVLGAPKDANAPEPRPKAEEALAEDEDTPPPERGEIALKGLERALDLDG